MDSIKLIKMQFMSIHTNIKFVQEDVEEAKEKQTNIFGQRLPALIILNLKKELKEESKLRRGLRSLKRGLAPWKAPRKPS